MFEFGRELKRLFHADAPKDGLTGGDASLLELLPLDMLRAEGRAADIAAGRISVKDRPQRQLEAAVVWREIARRTGDAAALRKAAAIAESAAEGFGRHERSKDWVRARCEQAQAGLLAADLFGDEGLIAAADFALADAQKAADNACTQADLGRVIIEARERREHGDRDAVLAAGARIEAFFQILDSQGRRRAACRLLAAGARMARADLLMAAGMRLRDAMLLRMAIDGLNQAIERLDPAYEPLSWSRTAMLRGVAQASMAALEGNVAAIADAINALVDVFETLTRDHSPLDWARAQLALAGVLQMLGEATESERAFDKAVGCHDRAAKVFVRQPTLLEAADAAYQRAVCLARRGEVSGDMAGLAEAETALRAELASIQPSVDPVGWAVRQLNFARLYEAQATVAGRDRGERAAAREALAAALDVFGEYGHRTLADVAVRGLERLKPSPLSA